MKKFLDWIVSLYTQKPTEIEEPTMADPELNGTDAANIAAAPAEAPVNTDKLKELLKVLGHDVEAVWEEAVSLAKKAI